MIAFASRLALAGLLLSFGCTKSHDVTGAALVLEDSGTGVIEVDAGDAGQSDPDAAPVALCPSSCGTTPSNPLISVTRCCTDEDLCGFEIPQLMAGLCLEEDAPGTPDPACPSVNLMGFINMPGCCRADGTCGSSDTFLGLGCTFNIEDQNIPCTTGPQ